MKSHLWLLSLPVIFIAGCGQQENTPTKAARSGTNATGGSVVTAPVDYLKTITKNEQDAMKTVDTTSLEKAIELFNVQEGRYPKDLNELVQSKQIGSLPPVPYGSKLDYDPATGKVKVVKQ